MSELIPELVWTQEEVADRYGAPATFSANGTAWVTYQGEQWAIGQRAEYCPPIDRDLPEVPIPPSAILMGSALIATVLIKRFSNSTLEAGG
jgi:hypothetical protein